MELPLVKSYCETLKKFGKVNFIYKNPSHLPYKQMSSSLLVDLGSWNLVNESKKESLIVEFFNDIELEMRFDFGTLIIPSTNKVLHWTGSFPVLLPLGYTPLPDIQIENIQNSQEMLNNLFQNLGIINRDSEYFKTFENVQCPLICTLSCPGIKLKDMSSYIILMATFLILDDIFDKPVDFWKDEVPIFKITKAVSVFSSIILGEKSLEDINERDGHGFPNFFPISRLMNTIRIGVLNFKKPIQETNYFFESFVEYMEAAAWESSAWATLTPIDINDKANAYIEMRKLTVGLLPCLNIICLLKNVQLNAEIRRDMQFKMLTNKLSLHVTLLNDLFSVRKDIQNREMLNIILIQNLQHPAQYSLDQTLTQIRSCVQQIFNIQEKLLLKFPDSNDLMEYFEIGNVWLDAHIRWMFFSGRYVNHDFEIDVIFKNKSC